VRALLENEVRQSFQGCSLGERKRLRIAALDGVAWENLDYFSWIDRSDSETGYMVYQQDGQSYGLVLSAAKAGKSSIRQSMCNFCRTIHSVGGVALFTTARWDEAGKRGDTVGEYICADLACSAYIRGLRNSGHVQIPTSKSVDQRVEELLENVATFVQRATNLELNKAEILTNE
jgi:hypothetical protein